MNRIERSQERMEALGETLLESDPEFTDILKHFIFEDILFTGNLDDVVRQLMTLVILTVNQSLPQIKSHTKVALKAGVDPIKIKEALYLCAPFTGFPSVLNALEMVNEVFTEQHIPLPLQSQKIVTEENRYEQGRKIQFPIYGDAIKERMKDLPGNLGEALPRLLTEFCFGDLYTRTGLDLQMRELLVLCILATLGGTELQVRSHALGNLKVGNSKETLISAMIHCIPYIGFPRALNAINIIKELN